MKCRFIIYIILCRLNICFSMKFVNHSILFARIPYYFTTIYNNKTHLSFLNKLFYTKMANSGDKNITIGLDPFCYKQFDKKGVNFIPYPKERFLDKVRESLKEGIVLRDGYAPFCKHLFVKNFTEATCGSIEITEENENLLKSGYLARTSKELPVLSRWFRKQDVLKYIKRAEYLDIIFYSRDQVIKEAKAMRTFDNESQYVHDYYIISIKPQDEDHELPMLPITVMRNALIDEGGSGVPIDRKRYAKAVEYWSKYAVFLED